MGMVHGLIAIAIPIPVIIALLVLVYAVVGTVLRAGMNLRSVSAENDSKGSSTTTRPSLDHPNNRQAASASRSSSISFSPNRVRWSLPIAVSILVTIFIARRQVTVVIFSVVEDFCSPVGARGGSNRSLDYRRGGSLSRAIEKRTVTILITIRGGDVAIWSPSP